MTECIHRVSRVFPGTQMVVERKRYHVDRVVSRDLSVSVNEMSWHPRAQSERWKEARQPQSIHSTSTVKLSASHNGVRVESFRPHVSTLAIPPIIGPSCSLIPLSSPQPNKYLNSYNKYLSVAARIVRRSLKEDKRLQAERRGEMELRFATWSVSGIFAEVG